MNPQNIRFDHEKLQVYQLSLRFITWGTELLERVPAKLSVHGQLDRASTSIPLNIAEGNGRFTPADRCRFFDMARGSTLECAAALDVLVAKKLLTEADIDPGKADLSEVTSMLFGLIRSNLDARLHEDATDYRAQTESEESVSEGKVIKNKMKSKSKNCASTTRFLILFLILILISFFISSVMAQDWPQWGGTSHRNMYSPAKGLPDRFDPGKTKKGSEEIDLTTTKNVKWVAKLGSQAYGNVTVAGGKVFIGTNNDSPRDPQHQGDRSILMCLDEKSGELLWQLVVPKLASGKVNDWENLGLLSSPTVEGDRVYLVTSRCEVMCLDVNGLTDGNQGFQDEAQYVAGPGKPKAKIGPRDADIIWKYDMIDELGVFPHNASNSSPLIVGDLVYVCTSNGQDWTHSNIPSPFSPSFIAVNKKTGELAGEDDAGIGPRIFHGQWSSPSTGTVNGKKLVFFGGGDGWLYAFANAPVKEGDTAMLKTVWKYDCNPPEYKIKDDKPIKYPAAEGPSEINATPVFYKNRVYVAIGQDPEHGEGVGHLVCVDATGTGDISRTGTVWDYRRIHRSISTVSIDPESGLLFVGDFSGFIHCLDAETGKVYWVHDMKAHMWGSTLVADGKVYCGDEDGDFVVFAASKEKKVLSETNLGSPVYATPVVANGVIYVASNYHLYTFYDAARHAPSSDQPKVDVNVKKPERPK